MIFAVANYLNFSGVVGSEMFSCLFYAVQILAVELMLIVNLPKQGRFRLRLITSSLAFLAISMPVFWVVSLAVPSFGYLSVFLLSFCMMLFWVDTGFWKVLFCCAVASTIQNFAYSIGVCASMLCGVYPDYVTNIRTAFIQVPVYVLAVVIMAGIGGMRIRGDEHFGVERISMVIISLISSVIIFLVQHNAQSFETENFLLLKLVFICSDVMSLMLLFDLQKQSRLKQENAILEKIIAQEGKQYELEQKTINIINLKCHDLKHQINALKELPQEERNDNISEIEKSVLIYDSIAKTGNTALDVILTSKGILCEQYKITLTYLVDGKKLDFMETMDIYSLFGNALDNAIEAVSHAPSDKRVINLMLSTRSDFICIHTENYCGDKLAFSDELPRSTKGNDEIHGFGLKSIRFIAEKYGGVMNVSVKGDIFCLDVLFPV
ncbi:MAG: ATP-binding protein [Oscillospiraceae bacterium]|nr:ATP-binding protein [Oscillospiraceae bacterium]